MAAFQLTRTNNAGDVEFPSDADLEALIVAHRGNRGEIAKLAAESMALATASESRAHSLENQGFLSRVWGSITGKNQRISARNSRDLARAQECAQRAIAKLAEQNALTMEVAISIGNRVNVLAAATQQEFAKTYQIIGQLAAETRSRLAEQDARLTRVEITTSLLTWKESIEAGDITWKGTAVEQLLEPQRLLFLTNGFYNRTNGDWDAGHLLQLRAILKANGFDPKAKLKVSDVIMAASAAEGQEMLFRDTQRGLGDLESPVHSPLLGAADKARALTEEESYLIGAVIEQVEAAGATADGEVVRRRLTVRWAEDLLGFAADAELGAYELAAELLAGLEVCTPATALPVAVIEAAPEVKEGPELDWRKLTREQVFEQRDLYAPNLKDVLPFNLHELLPLLQWWYDEEKIALDGFRNSNSKYLVPTIQQNTGGSGQGGAIILHPSLAMVSLVLQGSSNIRYFGETDSDYFRLGWVWSGAIRELHKYFARIVFDNIQGKLVIENNPYKHASQPVQVATSFFDLVSEKPEKYISLPTTKDGESRELRWLATFLHAGDIEISEEKPIPPRTVLEKILGKELNPTPTEPIKAKD